MQRYENLIIFLGAHSESMDLSDSLRLQLR